MKRKFYIITILIIFLYIIWKINIKLYFYFPSIFTQIFDENISEISNICFLIVMHALLVNMLLEPYIKINFKNTIESM